ncbi:MAG: 5'/3'-nucleotidase SurE [Acidobacteria bacterium]|nr:5'/3'-nucleotidase SurE [Acidobacteriota bacterium]MBI3664286.1 5'/3'-nucleotidase SurE [Acidobacteriota bacterium]
MPHILVTNDDGINAPGLRALVAALEGLGTVSVVAPMEERSGNAQSITLKRPIGVQPAAEREWAIDGTPTDAMIIALNKLFPDPPDLVLSGINSGGNMGENVYYSGTVGAAMEAVIHHIPAAAISVAHKGKDFNYADAARFARNLAELMLKEGMPRGVLLNVNVPNQWTGGVRFTHQSRKITRNVLKEDIDPRGRVHYWLHEQIQKDEVEPETDYAAVFSGAISITPLELDRTHETSLNHLSHWAKLLEGIRS